MVPYYEYALDMILDVEMPVGQTLTEEQQVGFQWQISRGLVCFLLGARHAPKEALACCTSAECGVALV